MSIVSSFTTPDVAAALKRQRRTATVSSVVIAILLVVLIGVILAIVLLPALVFRNVPIVGYHAELPKEEVVERPEVATRVQRQPSAPSSARSKVLASTAPSPVAVPVPEVDVPEPSLDFGDGDDFGEGWGSGSGFGGGGTTFFGQSVKAERIAYVIDYSQSMRKNNRAGHDREGLMRKELTDSVKQLAEGTRYALIFFAGPAWVAGDEVDWNRQGAIVTGKGGRKFNWKSNGKANDWEHSGKKEPVEWLAASRSQISKSRKMIDETRLVWGTRWDNPLNMALAMDPPPQAVYFMTDGVANGSKVWVKQVGADAKRLGVKINCIAMMEPRAEADMEELAKRTGGQFTIVTKDGKRRKVR